MAGVESSEGRKRHEEKAVRRTLEFPCARQLGKGRTFFFFFNLERILFYHGLPKWHSGKECACSAGDMGSIPESGRSPGEGNVYPLQYSCQESPMDRGA